MQTLSEMLERKPLAPHEDPFVAVDHATRYVFFMGPDGVERVDSAYRRVLVPLFDWPRLGLQEDTQIIRVLVEAAGANPLKVPTPSHVDDIFWVKNRGWRGLLFNPALAGKFLIPDDLSIFTSDLVPADQIILLGVPSALGFYVVRGNEVGVITNKKQGMLQIQFIAV